MSDEELARAFYDAAADYAVSRDMQHNTEVQHWAVIDDDDKLCLIAGVKAVREKLNALAARYTPGPARVCESDESPPPLIVG